MQARLHLLDVVTDVIRALDGGWIAAKQRDPQEPGLDGKERNQARLALLLRRYFNMQKERIREALEQANPDIKATAPPITAMMLSDDELRAQLLAFLMGVARDGVTLFADDSPLQIDWSVTNERAAQWARQYAYDWLDDTDTTTMGLLQDVLGRFVDTPGMTIGDVMAQLPFDPMRAERIAVTEITRVYAAANQLAGEDLRDEFPDLKVVKKWYTNNDSLVCLLCGPLHAKEVGVDETFYPKQGKYANGNPPRHVNCRCWMSTKTVIEG